MTSIGETLRRERLLQGLELKQVAQSTKIGTRMLQAMEQDDFSKLPGGVFTRSFVKQYAAALGLHPTALDEQLKELPTGLEEPVHTDTRKDVIAEDKHYSLSEYNSSTNSGGMLMSVFWVVAAMAVTGLVYYMMNRPQNTAPQRERAAMPAPAVPVPAQSPEKPAIAAVSLKPVRVELTATENAWVSLSADGKPQFSGVMKQNEKRMVDAAQRIKLVAGNAGAMQISWNEKPVDAIGPKGQVRVVEFTADGTHVVPRASPNPAPLP